MSFLSVLQLTGKVPVRKRWDRFDLFLKIGRPCQPFNMLSLSVLTCGIEYCFKNWSVLKSSKGLARPNISSSSSKLKLRSCSRWLPVVPGSENRIFEKEKEEISQIEQTNPLSGTEGSWKQLIYFFFLQSWLCCSREFPRHHRKVVTVFLRSIPNFPCLES